MEKMRLIGTLLLIGGALLLIIPPIAGAGLSAVLVILALAALGGGAAAFWYDRKQVGDESAESVAQAEENREQFKFYDVKFKKSFTSSTYEIRKRNNRYFAVSPSPFGSHECWRIIKSSKASSMMKKS